VSVPLLSFNVLPSSRHPPLRILSARFSFLLSLQISTSKAKAEAFVRVMHDKDKTGEWGFSVHEAKASQTPSLA